MRKVKLLFQGDSITDSKRDRNDIHHLGLEMFSECRGGYPVYAASMIQKNFPSIEFEFMNLGISGNQTKDLLERLETDFIALQPDIVSILVGINDVWHYAKQNTMLPDEIFEKQYRMILESIKDRTKAKIMMIEPFMIPTEDKEHFRTDLNGKINIVRKLALEFADVYLPLDGLFYSEYIGNNPLDYAADGVHPTPKGARFIADLYTEYIAKILV